MINTVVILAIIALLFLGVYWVCGRMTSGTPLQIIGLVLALIFVLVALNNLGIYHLH